MALTGTTSYSSPVINICTRAARIAQEIGSEESLLPGRLAEITDVLNAIIKEFNADGMQLWKRSSITIPLVVNQSVYPIGTGTSNNMAAPLKIIQAWTRLISGGSDSPMNLITKQQYDISSNKAATGGVNQLFYQTPGPTITAGQITGTIYLTQAPGATFAAQNVLYLTGVFPLEDATTTSDIDFPSYYLNALTWEVAKQLAYEGGLPAADRAQIAAETRMVRQRAEGFDMEEGSLYFQPEWQSYGWRN